MRGKALSKEQEEKLPELAKRFEEGEDIAILEKDYGIPKSTIYYYMKQMGIPRPKGSVAEKASRTPSPETVIRKREGEELASEAEKIATIALGIGGPIARRYMPLIDRLMSEGKPLEAIAEEIMSWYERKNSVLAEIEQKDVKIAQLDEELGVAYALAQPNIKYILKLRTLEKFAMKALRFKIAGFKVPVRTLLRAFQHDLDAIEKDMAGVFEEKTVGVVVPIE